ncbi:transcriptional regulator, TraR/DksA family [Roseovarius azorensis]|uniref:Transcriptional regulator, TraR/DksA family n=1 Tax=Roseovarius azorensis TaxID=1287727 RepID=A0A1H7HI40_9RHOB|nr:TraR/DksA C4-type zinc finger protein [Roseovarius azorensis]SEK47895.1 transcriptional regulator, TraR/DksA family [Roseovarius azorensis]
MNDTAQARFRTQIEALLAGLDAEDTRGRDGQATVELDQQAIGRLSRMDALQNQEMAKAGHARRQAQRRRLIAALARLDEGEYGYCEDCGEAIAEGRLALDPAATRCISCANG